MDNNRLEIVHAIDSFNDNNRQFQQNPQDSKDQEHSEIEEKVNSILVDKALIQSLSFFSSIIQREEILTGDKTENILAIAFIKSSIIASALHILGFQHQNT